MNDEATAQALDADDPLPTRRGEFRVPAFGQGDAAYFAGNSLGLQPRGLPGRMEAFLGDWAALGVEGWFEGERDWYSCTDRLRGPAARLVGALPEEVTIMNSLTVNLHLLMVSFYRPTPRRHAILIEDSAFPSDSYAVRSQAAVHGYDPDEAVIRLKPRPGEATLRTEDIVAEITRDGSRIALVLLGAVNYLTGELLDLDTITRAARDRGVPIGWDLAHAAGNVPLTLHDTGPDFAAWCTYKYLNSGPGSPGGVFVHSRHLSDHSTPRFAGWWGNDPSTRFEMAPSVRYPDSADSWQVSTPPVAALAPVLFSLEMFDQTPMPALRAKSLRLTGYLESLLEKVCASRPGTSVITPRDPERRGAQLSVRVSGQDTGLLSSRLRDSSGVYADARRPDVLRFAPAPLYNTFHDCWRAASALSEVLDE